MTSRKKQYLFKIIALYMIFISVINFKVVNTSANIDYLDISNIYVSEDNYSTKMNEEVIPYITSIMGEGVIEGEENIELYYRTYLVEDSLGSIVISHGFGEFIERYSELIYYFAKSGYNVFIMEHRGHGRSDTLGIVDETQIHVEDFDHYVNDLKKFLDEIVVPANLDNNLYLYAHSMGGGIGSKFLIDYANYFDAAVFNAPMMTIDTGSIPEFAANIIASVASSLGFGHKYVPGKSGYSTEQTLDESGTSSDERFSFAYNLEVSDEILQRGGPTLNWLNESLDATKYITSKKNASKVEIPILLFQADNDTYVKEKGQNKFAKYAENCELIKIENSKHEMYRECDEIQEDVIKKILEFYSNN